MRNQSIKFVIIFILFSNTVLLANDDLSVRVELALTRAGDNAGQLVKALDQVPDSHKEGMQFLIAYMPDRDLNLLRIFC